MNDVVTAQDVLDASDRIHGVLSWTPVREASSGIGLLKLENLQKTGAYKVRGALNALLAQRERGDDRPVIAASAGNHAAGVAWAARHTGLRATTVVPHGAPLSKVERTRELGAEVVFHGRNFDEASLYASHLAEATNTRLLHPFDDPEIIAGQGSVALEILDQKPDLVLVPIGGGGLAAGMATLLHSVGIPVIGVQIVGVDAMYRKILRTPLAPGLADTIADGIKVREPGARTAEILRRRLDHVCLVTEDEVRDAMVSLAAEDRIIAEGAGAVAVAAMKKIRAGRPLAVVSGGNIDMDDFRPLLDSRRSLRPHRGLRVAS